MKLRHLSPLLLSLAACLENDEEIEVRPDGSVHVTVSAKGDLADLTDGYPVPLDPRWRLASEDAERWVKEIGADTGSKAVRQRAGEVGWEEDKDEKSEAHLTVERDFPSVSDIPPGFAPESDPYRTAYLQRSASLEIREQGERRVFVFERTYQGFDYARLDVHGRIELPEEIEKKLEEDEPLTVEERRATAEMAASAFEEVAGRFAQDAILGLYTRGDASLAPRILPAILEQVRAAARAVVSFERLFVLLDLVQQDGDRAGEALEELEREWRAAIRAALAAALEQNGVGAPTRNAALFALEWEFTAFDHYGDLGDEEFDVSVEMPGTIVGGNFDSSQEHEARWEFDGQELQGKDVVIRVVSVLD